MSQQALQAFLAGAREDATLGARLAALAADGTAPDALDALVALGASAGHVFTRDDLQAAFERRVTELSDADLERATGGYMEQQPLYDKLELRGGRLGTPTTQQIIAVLVGL